MRKLTSVVLALFLLSLSYSAYAAVGIKVDGIPKHTATDINFKGATGTVTSDGSTTTFNIMLAGPANGGAASMTSNDTAVDPSYAFIRKNLGFNAQAGTLADGVPGQIITVLISQEVATGTFVLTPTTKTGYASLEFNDPGDLATLLYVSSTVGWVVVGANSLTVNQ